ncbi:MAG: hypothetical protein RR593_11240, partial [Hungatella sp.]
DTDAIYQRIKEQITARHTLSDEELMELVILPLTVKGTVQKQRVIVSAVNLAKQLPERGQAMQALAGILTFSDKVIDPAYQQQIKEEMQMTQIGQMLIDEGMERGLEQGLERGLERGLEQGLERGLEQIIRTMLLKNKTVEEIHADTDVPVEVIQKIKNACR